MVYQASEPTVNQLRREASMSFMSFLSTFQTAVIMSFYVLLQEYFGSKVFC
jgi:hypothetical protein